ncbi:MAG: hypothetical protein EOO08_09820 [Chitinophagaceae bacterium]|nr:MAG: hypothetical protein EOO08_09820 [Chitinophagaceae bacterium]
MDHTNFLRLDLEALKVMYVDAATRLKEALLNGAEWKALQELRHDVTELEIALYKKIRSTDDSAPFPDPASGPVTT